MYQVCTSTFTVVAIEIYVKEGVYKFILQF